MENCIICIEEILPMESCVISSCSHTFHHACIQGWVTRTSSTCPICRVEVATIRHTDPATGRPHTTIVVPRSMDDSDDDSDDEAVSDDDTEIVCHFCGRGDRGDELMLCSGEGCPGAAHCDCVQPALACVPEGDWFCSTCELFQNDERMSSQSTLAPSVPRPVSAPSTPQRGRQSHPIVVTSPPRLITPRRESTEARRASRTPQSNAPPVPWRTGFTPPRQQQHTVNTPLVIPLPSPLPRHAAPPLAPTIPMPPTLMPPTPFFRPNPSRPNPPVIPLPPALQRQQRSVPMQPPDRPPTRQSHYDPIRNANVATTNEEYMSRQFDVGIENAVARRNQNLEAQRTRDSQPRPLVAARAAPSPRTREKEVTVLDKDGIVKEVRATVLSMVQNKAITQPWALTLVRTVPSAIEKLPQSSWTVEEVLAIIRREVIKMQRPFSNAQGAKDER